MSSSNGMPFRAGYMFQCPLCEMELSWVKRTVLGVAYCHPYPADDWCELSTEGYEVCPNNAQFFIVKQCGGLLERMEIIP